ncbi:MAG: shikimate kinase [Thaumarchaeota archaeon]|nr:shikimate kinase [Nitrososphaerota archaeon]
MTAGGEGGTERAAGAARGQKGASATVHGAISIVNALATRKGATLGVALRVEADVLAVPGRGGITVTRKDGRRGGERRPGGGRRRPNHQFSSRLIQKTVQRVVPKSELESSRIEIAISSEMPAGFGLKSSSAISSAVALACDRAFGLRMSDHQILLAGVEASIASKVSITGAYDDACSCYYGGFNVTDNARRRLVRHQRAPRGMSAVIFIPKSRRRGNLKRLRLLREAFDGAWGLAKRAEYWKAMTVNGLATASVLGSDPELVARLAEKGALAASVSGNGPAIAAVAKDADVQGVSKVFAASMEGRTIVSGLSNKKAEAHDTL